MAASGIPRPSDSVVIKAVTKDETAKHCRRCTRGQSTTGNIEDLLLYLTSLTDTLEVPVPWGGHEPDLGGGKEAHSMPSQNPTVYQDWVGTLRRVVWSSQYFSVHKGPPHRCHSTYTSIGLYLALLPMLSISTPTFSMEWQGGMRTGVQHPSHQVEMAYVHIDQLAGSQMSTVKCSSLCSQTQRVSFLFSSWLMDWFTGTRKLENSLSQSCTQTGTVAPRRELPSTRCKLYSIN